MPLAPRANSYGWLETLEILGVPYISTWNYAWPIEGNLVFSHQGTQGRVRGQKRQASIFVVEIWVTLPLAILYGSTTP